ADFRAARQIDVAADRVHRARDRAATDGRADRRAFAAARDGADNRANRRANRAALHGLIGARRTGVHVAFAINLDHASVRRAHGRNDARELAAPPVAQADPVEVEDQL